VSKHLADYQFSSFRIGGACVFYASHRCRRSTLNFCANVVGAERYPVVVYGATRVLSAETDFNMAASCYLGMNGSTLAEISGLVVALKDIFWEICCFLLLSIH
jgi:hypothetical protein